MKLFVSNLLKIFIPDFSPFFYVSLTYLYPKSGHSGDSVLVSNFTIFWNKKSKRKDDIIKVSHSMLLDQWISGFIVFIAVIWLLQEKTKVHILRYVILFIGMFLSFSRVSFKYFELVPGWYLCHFFEIYG